MSFWNRDGWRRTNCHSSCYSRCWFINASWSNVDPITTPVGYCHRPRGMTDCRPLGRTLSRWFMIAYRYQTTVTSFFWDCLLVLNLEFGAKLSEVEKSNMIPYCHGRLQLTVGKLWGIWLPLMSWTSMYLPFCLVERKCHSNQNHWKRFRYDLAGNVKGLLFG